MGRSQPDQLSEKFGGEFAIVGIDVVDIADVAVINLLVVVVLNLHHLIAGREGPPEALDPTLARGVQCCLQFDIEGACADAAPIHRAKNLDVADGVEAESFRNACFHQLDDAWHGGFGDRPLARSRNRYPRES